MRSLFFILFVFFISCNSKNSKEIQNISESEEAQPFVKAEKPKKQIDTNSFQYFLELTNDYGKLPKHLVDSFVSPKWFDTDDQYRDFYGSKGDYVKFGEIYLATINIGVYGVCSITVLTSYKPDGKVISTLEVESTCDRDLSSPTYNYTDYFIHSDTLIEIIETKQEPKDKSLMYSDTVDFSEVEQEYKKEYSHYIIKHNGVFQKVKSKKEPCVASDRIIESEFLSGMTKEELRLLRNEIFARKGYIFKSPDLTKYFEHFDWYKPNYDNVTNKLTPVEIYNIQLIKNYENK